MHFAVNLMHCAGQICICKKGNKKSHSGHCNFDCWAAALVLMSRITSQCTEGPAQPEQSWSDLGHVKINLLSVNLIKLFIERSDCRRRNSSKLYRKSQFSNLPLPIQGEPPNIFIEIQTNNFPQDKHSIWTQWAQKSEMCWLISVKSPGCQECKYFILKIFKIFLPTWLQFFQVPANKGTLLLAACGVLKKQNEDGRHWWIKAILKILVMEWNLIINICNSWLQSKFVFFGLQESFTGIERMGLISGSWSSDRSEVPWIIIWSNC